MSTWAVSMMRDEADVAPYVVRHMLEDEGCAGVLVYDNLSTDGTGDLCRDAGACVFPDPEVAYNQSVKMTRLVHKAGQEYGATWVLPFDADEWFWSVDGELAATLEAVRADVVMAAGYDYLPALDDDPGELNPFRRLRWRRTTAQQLPKVAFRYNPSRLLGQGNHSVTGGGWTVYGPLEFRHVQWRSLAQMKRKVRQGAAAYAATDLPESEGAHWRRLGAFSDEEIAHEWCQLVMAQGLVYDPL